MLMSGHMPAHHIMYVQKGNITPRGFIFCNQSQFIVAADAFAYGFAIDVALETSWASFTPP